MGYDLLGPCRSLLEQLRVNRWRAKALELVSEIGVQQKPVCTPEFLERVRAFLKEGTSTLDIDEATDPFYAGISDAMAQNEAWVKQARDLMTQSAEPHTLDWYMLQSKVQSLVEAASNLTWRITDDQFSELKEHLAVYCLCQRIYDNEPMLACDSCSNWFHFGCVGRLEDPTLANEIENWNCPICVHANSMDGASHPNGTIGAVEMVAVPESDGKCGHGGSCGAQNGDPANGAAELTKKGKKRKKKNAPSAPPVDAYYGHIRIEGAAKETLTTIQRVLPSLLKSLDEPDVHKRVLEMYSRPAFQRAILANHVPDEVFESVSERELLKKLEKAMRTGDGDPPRPNGSGGPPMRNKALCDTGPPSAMDVDEALQID